MVRVCQARRRFRGIRSLLQELLAGLSTAYERGIQRRMLGVRDAPELDGMLPFSDASAHSATFPRQSPLSVARARRRQLVVARVWGGAQRAGLARLTVTSCLEYRCEMAASRHGRMKVPATVIAERHELRKELVARLGLRYRAKVNAMVVFGAILALSNYADSHAETSGAWASLFRGEAVGASDGHSYQPILTVAPIAAMVFASCWLHHVLRILRLSSFFAAQEQVWSRSGLAYEECVSGEGWDGLVSEDGEPSSRPKKPRTKNWPRWIPGFLSAFCMFLLPSFVSAELTGWAIVSDGLWLGGTGAVIALVGFGLWKKSQTASVIKQMKVVLERHAKACRLD